MVVCGPAKRRSTCGNNAHPMSLYTRSDPITRSHCVESRVSGRDDEIGRGGSSAAAEGLEHGWAVSVLSVVVTSSDVPPELAAAECAPLQCWCAPAAGAVASGICSIIAT